MPLRIKEEIPDPAVVEEKKNEYANEGDQTMEKRQDEEQYYHIIFENVMVEINKFGFPIDLVTLGKEEDIQALSKEKPSNALSRAWIDVKHGEMTLLVDKEKVKFNLYQSIQLTDEERNICMRIERSLLHLKEQAPDILQEESLEGIELNTNFVSTKELELELKLHNLDVEELILMKDKDEEEAVARKDKGLKQRASTFPISLTRL